MYQGRRKFREMWQMFHNLLKGIYTQSPGSKNIPATTSQDYSVLCVREFCPQIQGIFLDFSEHKLKFLLLESHNFFTRAPHAGAWVLLFSQGPTKDRKIEYCFSLTTLSQKKYRNFKFFSHEKRLVTDQNLQSITTFLDLQLSRYSKSVPVCQHFFQTQACQCQQWLEWLPDERQGLNKLSLSKLSLAFNLNSALWPMSYCCFICSKLPK